MKLTFVAGIVACLLSGCATQAVHQIDPPKTVTVTVSKYVPIPDDLTQPSVIDQPQNDTVAEALRVARARRTALEQCNADKSAIRDIGAPK